MFVEADITDDYRKELEIFNVTELDEMLAVLNGLDYIAEIGYSVYKNNQLNHFQNEKTENYREPDAGGADNQKEKRTGKKRKGCGHMDKGIVSRPIQVQ